MSGKLIVIEGTDCSGKQTQSDMLFDKLKGDGIKIFKSSFPMYNSPTGKIVGGCYLGKPHLSYGAKGVPPLFDEGASRVNPKVASLFFAADRLYNIEIIKNLLAEGTTVILDRYIESNIAHQGGKIEESAERLKMYRWLEKLEYGLLELPKPDMTIFLHVPAQSAIELRKGRIDEKADQHEISSKHIQDSERAYLELAQLYNFKTISCVNKGAIRAINDIHNEVYLAAKNLIVPQEKKR